MKMEVHKMIGSLGASGREGAGRLNIRAEVGVELAGWMSGVLATPFFRNICGEKEGEAALLQAMYLMDGRDSGRNYSPLGDYAEMEEYCHEARGDYTARKRGIIQCLAEYLSEAFPEGSPGVKAEHVPMCLPTRRCGMGSCRVISAGLSAALGRWGINPRMGVWVVPGSVSPVYGGCRLCLWVL